MAVAFTPKKISRTATARYTVRFFITLLKMEKLINVMHFVAIKEAHAWSGMSSASRSIIGLLISLPGADQKITCPSSISADVHVTFVMNGPVRRTQWVSFVCT